MQFQLIIVLVVTALATVVAYLALGRVLPEHWHEVKESEAFTIDSINVLIGLLFSILLAFVIAGVLDEYNHARSNAQQEANAIGAIYGYAQGIPRPVQSIWKNDNRNCTNIVINQDWPLMQHHQSSEAAWTTLTTYATTFTLSTAPTAANKASKTKRSTKSKKLTTHDAPELISSTRASPTSCGTPSSAGQC